MFALALFVALSAPANLQQIAVENVTLRVELDRVDRLYQSLRLKHESLERKHEDLVGDYADLKADYDHLLAARQRDNAAK